MPTGVIINKLGNVKAIFSKSMVTLDICVDDIKDAITTCKLAVKKLLTPNPPLLKLAGSNTLSIKWEFIYPPGLSQQAEVQYISSKVFSHVRPASTETTDIPRQPKRPKESQWQSLVTRSWSLESFDSYTLENLPPGAGYYFRIRIWSHEGWSQYSEMSELLRTFASRPSQPGAPVITASMPSCLQLRWARGNSNGSPIKGYILRGKIVGDESEYEEVYKGPSTSYLVMGLKSESQYSFEIASENDIGLSDYSIIASGRTSAVSAAAFCTDSPHVAAAMKNKAAWSECWDPRTEQYFYFNFLTGIRQTEIPEALMDIKEDLVESEKGISGDDADTKSVPRVIEEIDSKKEADIIFRKKRFRLLKNIHQYTALLRRKPGAPLSLSHLPPKANADLFAIELRRSHLLIDGYRAISRAQLLVVCNRMKVSFHGMIISLLICPLLSSFYTVFY